MKEYIKKWNNYKIGDVRWINKNRDHFSRTKFLQYIDRKEVNDILEIGGGELIEATALLANRGGIKYSVADISPVFLKNARKIKEINVYKGDMVNLPFEDKQFDLIYVHSVLEHSPNIITTLREFSRVSKRFYLTMFKWMNKTGGLKSNYKEKKKFYSTLFNIDMLLNLVMDFGFVDEVLVCSPDGDSMSFEEYKAKNPDLDGNRNKMTISIIGSWDE